MLYLIIGILIGWGFCHYKHKLDEEREQLDEDYSFATRKIQELQAKIKELEGKRKNTKKNTNKVE